MVQDGTKALNEQRLKIGRKSKRPSPRKKDLQLVGSKKIVPHAQEATHLRGTAPTRRRTARRIAFWITPGPIACSSP
eukprot:5679258-Amphidinium_carterae.1